MPARLTLEQRRLLDARELRGALRGCALLRRKVRRHGDDCLRHVIVQMPLRSLHQRPQHLRRHLLWV